MVIPRWSCLFAGLALCALSTAPAMSQTLRDSVPSIDVVRSRLNLTPEQEATLTPLFQQRATDLQRMRARYEQAASRRGKQDVLRAAKSATQSFNTQVESVLNNEQKAEWRELRDETREKVKERYEQKQESEPR